MEKKSSLAPGFVLFAISIIFLITAGSLLQTRYGLMGLAATEIGLLAIAILGAMSLPGGIRKAFEVKMPQLKEASASFCVYIGTYGFTIGAATLLLYLFPAMAEVSNAINDFFSEGGWLLVVAVSILPGICEEALFRGTIQSVFSKIQTIWIIVAITGVLFGLFHLDVYRFLPTMILGFGFAYIMAKTGNLLYSILLHMIHNFLGIMPLLFSNGEAAANEAAVVANPIQVAGSAAIFFGMGFLFVALGVRKFNGESLHKGNKKQTLLTIICFVVIAAGFMAINSSAGAVACDMDLSLTFYEEYNESISFDSPVAGVYQVEISIDTNGSRGYVELFDTNGKLVFMSGEGTSFSASGPVSLEKGSYFCHIVIDPVQEDQHTQANVKVLVKR
ncbi:MAG: CPBP family intramembrane metalloprotease [Eubacteriaceae bacterium]|nr:CPBP family intramembrane metalloprotease [Eubacteriaceae bacterium]